MIFVAALQLRLLVRIHLNARSITEWDMDRQSENFSNMPKQTQTLDGSLRKMNEANETQKSEINHDTCLESEEKSLGSTLPVNQQIPQSVEALEVAPSPATGIPQQHPNLQKPVSILQLKAVGDELTISKPQSPTLSFSMTSPSADTSYSSVALNRARLQRSSSRMPRCYICFGRTSHPPPTEPRQSSPTGFVFGDSDAEPSILSADSAQSPPVEGGGWHLTTEERGRLIQPCLCENIWMYVHEGCLARWVNQTNNHKCSVCKFPFKTVRSMPPLRKWKRLPMERAERRRIICISMLHIIFLAFLVLLTALVLTAAPYSDDGNASRVIQVILPISLGCFGLTLIALQLRHYLDLFSRWKKYNTQESFIVPTEAELIAARARHLLNQQLKTHREGTEMPIPPVHEEVGFEV